jgi:hypothetical protein
VLEIRPRSRSNIGRSRWAALIQTIRRPKHAAGPIDAALYGGDDRTDRDAFAAHADARCADGRAAGTAACIAVASAESPRPRSAIAEARTPDGSRARRGSSACSRRWPNRVARRWRTGDLLRMDGAARRAGAGDRPGGHRREVLGCRRRERHADSLIVAARAGGNRSPWSRASILGRLRRGAAEGRMAAGSWPRRAPATSALPSDLGQPDPGRAGAALADRRPSRWSRAGSGSSIPRASRQSGTGFAARGAAPLMRRSRGGAVAAIAGP